jgi:large subunit ribosomal protein L24
MKKTKIKKNDQVVVISGRSRGAKGKVLRVMPARELAVVERVNMVKRHTKQNAQKGIQGGVLEPANVRSLFAHARDLRAGRCYPTIRARVWKG